MSCTEYEKFKEFLLINNIEIPESQHELVKCIFENKTIKLGRHNGRNHIAYILKEYYLMKNIRVFKINNTDWYMTNKSQEDMKTWYEESIEIDVYSIDNVGLYKEGMWGETIEEEDAKRLGSLDESLSDPFAFGDLQKINGAIFKYISFREAVETTLNSFNINIDIDFEPVLIASTEF